MGNYDFGYYDMGRMLDIMEDRFQEISRNRELLSDEEFMMDMFVEIENKVDPFAEYLDFMFTEKQSRCVGRSQLEKDKVLPYDELHTEIFYPT